jgi:hypothetical protein
MTPQIPPTLQEALMTVDGGAILTTARHKGKDYAIVAMKVPPDTHVTDQTPFGYGTIVLADTDFGPIISLAFQVFDHPENPLTLDTFLNPSNNLDRNLLHILATADLLIVQVCVVFNGKLACIATRGLRWNEEHQVGAIEALRRTEGTMTTWPAAKRAYIRDHPWPRAY